MNGEAIYDTRPWKVFGEGTHWVKAGTYQGQSVHALSAADIRFTQNKAGTQLYAIALGWPSEAIEVRSLGADSPTKPGKITNVELLGAQEKLTWKQTRHVLHVKIPKTYHPKADYAAALKVTVE